MMQLSGQNVALAVTRLRVTLHGSVDLTALILCADAEVIGDDWCIGLTSWRAYCSSLLAAPGGACRASLVSVERKETSVGRGESACLVERSELWFVVDV